MGAHDTSSVGVEGNVVSDSNISLEVIVLRVEGAPDGEQVSEGDNTESEDISEGDRIFEVGDVLAEDDEGEIVGEVTLFVLRGEEVEDGETCGRVY